MLPDNFSDTDIAALADSTPGCSGSDLKEVCRDASMIPLREYMKEHGGNHADMVKGLQEVRAKDGRFQYQTDLHIFPIRVPRSDRWSYVISTQTTAHIRCSVSDQGNAVLQITALTSTRTCTVIWTFIIIVRSVIIPTPLSTRKLHHPWLYMFVSRRIAN